MRLSFQTLKRSILVRNNYNVCARNHRINSHHLLRKQTSRRPFDFDPRRLTPDRAVYFMQLT